MFTPILYFQTAAAFAGALAWANTKDKLFFRPLQLLLFIILGVEVCGYYIRTSGGYNSWLYNAFMPVQFGLYYLAFYNGVKSKRAKNLILFGSLIFCLVFILTQIFIVKKHYFNVFGFAAGSLFLCLAAALKIYEFATNPLEKTLYGNPTFLISFTIFSFHLVTLPYFLFANWMAHKNFNNILRQLLMNSLTISNFILYGVYTLIFVWLIRKRISG